MSIRQNGGHRVTYPIIQFCSHGKHPGNFSVQYCREKSLSLSLLCPKEHIRIGREIKNLTRVIGYFLMEFRIKQNGGRKGIVLPLPQLILIVLPGYLLLRQKLK